MFLWGIDVNDLVAWFTFYTFKVTQLCIKIPNFSKVPEFQIRAQKSVVTFDKQIRSSAYVTAHLHT
jgi:hypothetical protein